MRAFILAVTGVARYRIGAMSLIASAIAVILSCSGLRPTGPEVESVTVTLTATTPIVGQTLSAVVTLRDPTGLKIVGQPIAWSLSNPAVATIATSGYTAQITAIAAGSTEVTATTNGQSGSAALSVAAAPSAPVASISVALASSTLNPGQTTQASATTRDANDNVLLGRAVSWSSSNTGIATVSQSGVVTAVATGSAQITATSEGRSGNAVLTISAPPPAPVASVSVTLAASSRAVGQTTQATATTRDANNNVLTGRPISWSSSNTVVATVSSSGLVTAAAAGTASITATSEGQSGSATFTVTAPPPPPPPPAPVASVSVALGVSSLSPGQTTQATATTRDANNNVLTGRAISWSSSNNTIATVSNSGVVTAVAAGTAQVTATSEGKSGSATLTVTAAPPPPSGSNEPAGMTLISERLFNALDESGWSDSNGGSGGGLSIFQDPTAPISPSNVLRATYPQGFTSGGDGPGGSDRSLQSQPRTLYVRFWAKLSSNFYCHHSGTNKQFYAYDLGNNAFFFFSAGCQGTGAIKPVIQFQSTASHGDYDLEPNLVPAARIPRGAWYRIEVLVTGNTAGTSNGTMDVWLDGVHVTSMAGLRYSSGNTFWGRFHYTSIWGGVSGPNVPATQYMDWDHVYLSGKN